MATANDQDGEKRVAAEAAVAEVREGMVIGLGTGSTAAFAIAALGRRVRDGLSIAAVPTSRTTEAAARAAGIPLRPLASVDRLDLCIDGVDEIDGAFRGVKGGGGAMLIEKIVAAMARRNIAIADATKLVGRIGGRPVPLEVLPAAIPFVSRKIRAMGGAPIRRMAGPQPYVTDSGHAILDGAFPSIDDPAALAAALAAIPGVLGHGLFLTEIDALVLGGPAGAAWRERGGGSAGPP